MFDRLKSLSERSKRNNDLYFSAGIQEITSSNIKTLQQVSGVATILVTGLVLLTPYIITGWEPTIQHILFAPVLLAFFIISTVVRKKKITSPSFINSLCLVFVAMMFSFVIAIDVFQFTDQPASFMQLSLITIPAVFVFKLPVIFSMLGVFEVVFTVTEYMNKVTVTAQNDFFNSLVGFLVSILVASMIQRLRAEGYVAKQQYVQLSMTDGLTGILNKASSELAAQNYLENAPEDSPCTLIMIDIDNFKQVNDTLGHKAGDEVLEHFGSILRKTFRSTDILGRFGGDEFIVLMRNVSDANVVNYKCDMLVYHLKELSEIMNYTITCSAGVVLFNGEKIEYNTLFKAADAALYEAKESGKAKRIVKTI